jgi:hypothetical protein
VFQQYEKSFSKKKRRGTLTVLHRIRVAKAVNGRRRLAWILVSILLSAGLINAQMDEYSIKAGYLYNFSKYVVWPEGTFASATTPFIICILGDDPFGSRIDQAIAGKTAGDGRPLEVKRIKNASSEELHACQIIFIAQSEKKNAALVMETVKSIAVFTVADFSPFAENGGVADLRIEGMKVRVDLNMAAATRANLKVSGKLQQVANLVN